MGEIELSIESPIYPNEFVSKVEDLNFLLETSEYQHFLSVGGFPSLFHTLRTDEKEGISSFSVEARQKHFGVNVIKRKKTKSFFYFIWEAMNDKILIMLIIAGIASLILGIYQAIKNRNGSHCFEGASIFAAIFIVVFVTAFNDYNREKQFKKLNLVRHDRQIKIIRDSYQNVTSINDIVVGDIVQLEPGEVIPADGVLAYGSRLLCDESELTGESEGVEKSLEDKQIFLKSGSKVLEGTGGMLVLAVGPNSTSGKLMASMEQTYELTPLQVRLNAAAELIAKVGICIASALLLILMGKYAYRNYGIKKPVSQTLMEICAIFIECLSLLVVAVPEGLPLAVTLVLAYSTIRMLKDNNLVRVMSACETMGNATVVCTDKTGTLTTNTMTVVEGSVLNQDFGISLAEIHTMNDEAKKLIAYSISINSTAFEALKPDSLDTEFIGSKTEAALLTLVKSLDFDYAQIRQNNPPCFYESFSSKSKAMSTFIQAIDGSVVQYTKGASEIILAASKYYVDNFQNVQKISDEQREIFSQKISEMSRKALRIIALAYKIHSENGKAFEKNPKNILENLILIGFFGIQDPLRENIEEAVEKCQKAGIKVIMITGDSVETATSIAKQCKILRPNGIVIEGSDFRKLEEDKLLFLIPSIQVIARSSPQDKQKLVKKLKELGEVVAVTGDGTNDGPALKAADVGFSMGLTGTEVAKEASSIILMDDNFCSIVKAITWGRCINDSLRKFLQFMLTVNVSAVIITFVTESFSLGSKKLFSAIQLLWINMIMDTFAALALATNTPTEDLLGRKPEPRRANLITRTMWAMIIFQATFQILLICGLYFYNRSVSAAFIYNTFIMLQLFNLINCRSVHDEDLNVFQGFFSNWVFLFITALNFVFQFLIMTFGGEFFNIDKRLGIKEWIYSMIIGSSSLILGVTLRIARQKYVPPVVELPEVSENISEERIVWRNTIGSIRAQLKFYNALRRPNIAPIIPAALD